MWPFGKNVTLPPITDKTRVVVCIGGAGALGQALTKTLPESVVLVNVSRTRTLSYSRAINVAFDVETGSEETCLAEVLTVVPRIDALIYAPFMSFFTPLHNMARRELLREVELLGVLPIAYANAFQKYAEEHPSDTSRTYMAIGSGIYKGLPKDRLDLGSYGASKCYLNYALSLMAPSLTKNGVRTVLIHPGTLKNPDIEKSTTARIWEEVHSTDPTESIRHYEFF